MLHTRIPTTSTHAFSDRFFAVDTENLLNRAGARRGETPLHKHILRLTDSYVGFLSVENIGFSRNHRSPSCINANLNMRKISRARKKYSCVVVCLFVSVMIFIYYVANFSIHSSVTVPPILHKRTLIFFFICVCCWFARQSILGWVLMLMMSLNRYDPWIFLDYCHRTIQWIFDIQCATQNF